MKTIKFLVQGSSAEPYKVEFVLDGKNLRAYCTCAAGESGQYCKHRLRIIDGDITGIVSANSESASEVKSWLPGTDVDDALKAIKHAEAQLDLAKDLVSSAKKKLARSMMK